MLALVLALRPAPAPPGAGRPSRGRGRGVGPDLPAGTVLTAADLAVARYPPDAVPGRASPRPRSGCSAGSSPASVRAREPITDARLVGPGLTALLPDGQVAAPVRLADLAVAGARAHR